MNERLIPEGIISYKDFAEWKQLHPNDELVPIAQEVGKNSIFQVVLGNMRYLTDVVNEKNKVRIVLDYDPEAVNWVMTIFTARDAQIPEDIR